MICRFALVWMKRARNDESGSCFFGATGICGMSRPSGTGTISEKDEISRSPSLAVFFISRNFYSCSIGALPRREWRDGALQSGLS